MGISTVFQTQVDGYDGEYRHRRCKQHVGNQYGEVKIADRDRRIVWKSDAQYLTVVDPVAGQEDYRDAETGQHHTFVSLLAALLDEPKSDQQQDCRESVKRRIYVRKISNPFQIPNSLCVLSESLVFKLPVIRRPDHAMGPLPHWLHPLDFPQEAAQSVLVTS